MRVRTMKNRKALPLSHLELQEISQEFVSVAELQRHIMPDPDGCTVFGDYDIFGRTLPTAVVGGDYFDFIELENRFGMKGRVGLVIADAAGHGLVAAMLIRDFNTALYTAISFQSHYEKDTTALLFTKINRRMFRSSQPSQFISAFYGELGLTGRLAYINAGHYNPLLFKPDRIIDLDVGGPVLGAFRDYPTEYQIGETHMDPGDVLISYTDGVIEAEDGRGEAYGAHRLIEQVSRHRERTAREIFAEVIRDVEEFSADFGQTDDRTLIVVKRTGELATGCSLAQRTWP